MSKRHRADSATEAARIMSASGQPITVPKSVRLEEGDMPFFESVVAEFARTEWTNHSLEIAAMLARTMSDLEHEQYELRKEGSVMKSDKGTPVVNPRKTVVQMHAGAILSFRRSLQLHARAQGEARDTGKRRKIAKEIEADAPDGEDGLLATPN